MITLRILCLLLLCLVTIACESIQLNAPRQALVSSNRTSEGRITYVIEGIQLDGCSITDYAANRQVRVDVFSQFRSGGLQLNAAFIHLADFTCTFPDWDCQGGSNDGKDRSAMTFVADPMDVDAILSNLTFTPFIARAANGGPEFVVVRVYSGHQGGNCWSDVNDGFDLTSTSGQHSSLLSDNNCTQTQGVIPILPDPAAQTLSDTNSKQEETSQEWYKNALFDSVVVLMLGCLVLCCCSISHWWTYAPPCSLREYPTDTGPLKKGSDALFDAWDGGGVVLEISSESPTSGSLPVSPKRHGNRRATTDSF